MGLRELAKEQNKARLQRKYWADCATEEYLLAKIEEQEGGERAPSAEKIAKKWGVTRGMIEHRLYAIRQQQLAEMQEAEEEEGDPAGTLEEFLAAALGDVAQAVKEKKERATRPE